MTKDLFDELLNTGVFDNDLDEAEKLVRKRRREIGTKQKVLIGFVLDKSSSMSSVRDATIKGFNDWLREAKESMPDALLTLTLFNTTYETRYENTPIRDVQPLTIWTYVPDGMTALYDAVGDTITRMEREYRAGKYEKALVVIQTDGQENSSTRFQFNQIKSMVDEKQKDNWTIVALGADMDAWSVFGSWGLFRGNTLSYNSAQTDSTFRVLATNTAAYAATPAGEAVMDFFNPSDGGGKTDDQGDTPAGTGG